MANDHYRVVYPGTLREALGVTLDDPRRLPNSEVVMCCTYFYDAEGKTLGYASYRMGYDGQLEDGQHGLRCAGPETLVERMSVWF